MPAGSALPTASALPPASGERGPVWVEDLAGSEDYWLTLTDAARVTRRQEVTIRRWVASGSLPVRNRALGINKRTRHVRASDLARLSPIVDASATISGATARIDLLSIPEQQAQIQRRQTEIDQQARALMALVEQVGHAASTQQTQLDEQQARLVAIEGGAAALRSDLSTGAQLAEKRQAALGRQVNSLQQNLRRLDVDCKRLLDEQQVLMTTQERVAERQTEQETEQRGYLARIQELEKQQNKDARDRGKLAHRIDEVTLQTSNLTSNLEQHLHKVENGLAQLREELHQQEAVARQQTIEYAQQLQALQQHLSEADNRSQAVAALVAGEHEQLQQLSERVSELAAQMTVLVEASAPASQPSRRRRTRQPSRTTSTAS